MSMRLAPFMAVFLLFITVEGRAAGAELTLPFEQESFEAMQAEGRPILVDISASWCPTCARQHAVLEAIFEDGLYPDLVVLTVDYDDQRSVVRDFRAMRQSTLIVFRGDQETGRAVAITSREDIENLLDTAYAD